MVFSRNSIVFALSAALGLFLVAPAAFAQTAYPSFPCTSFYYNGTNGCTTATLSVYLQVIAPTDNTTPVHPASDFTVAVSGQNASPASFPGSQSGTLVSLTSGSTYNVSLGGNTFGYTPSYSQGCSGTIYNDANTNTGSNSTCIITLSATSYSLPPVPFPYPYGTVNQLVCSPAYQNAAIGQAVEFTAQGGNGGPYDWTTPNQQFINIGPVLTTTFMNSGTQTVTVHQGTQVANCTVVISSTPIAPINPVNPIYPTLPNTGFAPTDGSTLALLAVLLIGASIYSYPYVRKAFVSISR